MDLDEAGVVSKMPHNAANDSCSSLPVPNRHEVGGLEHPTLGHHLSQLPRVVNLALHLRPHSVLDRAR
jgi:hypothetical protein